MPNLGTYLEASELKYNRLFTRTSGEINICIWLLILYILIYYDIIDI